MDNGYKSLKAPSELFWDCQEFRKAMENKARSGEVDPELVATAAGHYRAVEKLASKVMVTELRRTAPAPVLAWIRESPGIGEHLAAKLLGAIGDPYIARPMHWEERPGAKGGKDDPKRVLAEGEPYIRNVAKLWAICGVGDPARKRRTGMTAAEAAALGNWKAKTTLRLLAESCVKQPGSRYEQVYREARERYSGRVHTAKCVQCKGSTEPGQPWKDGHKNAAALRKVAKEILRDLWEAAREAHTNIPRDQQHCETQKTTVPGEAA
jgi:hypothetical protein